MTVHFGICRRHSKSAAAQAISCLVSWDTLALAILFFSRIIQIHIIQIIIHRQDPLGVRSVRRTFYEYSDSGYNLAMPSLPPALAWAHPLVAEWFVRKFGTPTEPQEQG